MMNHLILIAGVSRSGKSSLAEDLCARLENSIHLDQDEFVLPVQDIPLINDRTDWETPESIDWKKWKHKIQESLESYSYVIAEGIFALGDSTIIEIASTTILLSISKEEYLERRKKETRWGNEPDWFLEHVWDAHLKFHNPLNIKPDFELTNFYQANLEAIVARLKTI